MTVERKHAHGTHTIMRSDVVKLGPARLFRHREPAEGVDPYDLDFNQHDDRNYPRVHSYVFVWGPFTASWSPR